MGFLFGSPSKQTSTSSSTSSSNSGNSAYGTLNNALSPTLGYGAQAGNMMGSLLGLPSSSPATPMPTSPSYNDQTMGGYNPYQPGGFSGEDRLPARFNLDGSGGSGYPGPAGQEAPVNLLNESRPQASTPGQGSALENFSNSAGMDFLRGQGVKAIEASQAGKGMLQSGATGQALSSFGNNLAKTYLNDYLTHLNDYANIGTKNAAVLSGAGGYSNSTGLSSGTGSGTGQKQGLISSLGPALISAFA